MKKIDQYTWIESKSLNDDWYDSEIEWHHISLAYKNNFFLVYYDGRHYSTARLFKSQNRTTGSGNVLIGSQSAVHPPFSLEPEVTTTASPASYGSMTVDELAIWNVALSSNQVAQIYNTES